MLARFGGDEFVAVGRGPKLNEETGSAARMFQERLTLQCNTRMNLGTVEIQSSGASVGVVLIDPHTTSAENALTQADAAMYAVKRLRRLEREQQG